MLVMRNSFVFVTFLLLSSWTTLIQSSQLEDVGTSDIQLDSRDDGEFHLHHKSYHAINREVEDFHRRISAKRKKAEEERLREERSRARRKAEAKRKAEEEARKKAAAAAAAAAAKKKKKHHHHHHTTAPPPPPPPPKTPVKSTTPTTTVVNKPPPTTSVPVVSSTQPNQVVVTTSTPTSSPSSSSASASSSSSSSSSFPSQGLPLPTYTLTQQNRGANFYSGGYWNFWSYNDPTHGTVQYVNQSTAQSMGLISINSNNQAIARASVQNLPVGQNRPSVRFQSNPAYDAALVVMDVAKMPVGCATWPALWTVMGSQWPQYGEIDIMEGIGYTSMNTNENLISVHMNGTSYLTNNGSTYTGKLVDNNCMTNYGLGNTGCQFYDKNANGPSWGTNFNSAGGGVWAALWGGNMGVRVWFWGRQSGLIPPELSNPSISPSTLNPTSWGTPVANFQSQLIDSNLKQQNIVLDLTINGDWAGYETMDNQAQCGTNHSAALAVGTNYIDAEFILNGIDVYLPGSSGSSS